jgi:predicted RNase H-like HicB family nuclease
MESSQLHIVVRHEDNAFWATVREFPGVFATGDDLVELRESLEEGIALIMAEPNGAVPKINLSPLSLAPTVTEASSELIAA